MNGDTARVDAVVAGAGVVGLAIAAGLARAGLEVLVVEPEPGIGSGISSRNSGVIHAGIYYPPDSLKARLCVRGRRLLYDYCSSHGVAYRRCGKLIVAQPEQLARLAHIGVNAAQNGVDDLVSLSGTEAATLEPELDCAAALLSPATGIVDTNGLMLALSAELQDAGGVIAFGAAVQGGDADMGEIRIDIGGNASITLTTRYFVNAAGLNAFAIAQSFGVSNVPQRYLAKGSYFALARPSPFSRLVYPVPEPGGLGIHSTLDLAGRTRFGPDVEWVDCLDYRVAAEKAPIFAAAIRRYWPAICADDLMPDYAGIRPRIVADRYPDADFVLLQPTPRSFHLLGIESPGLTAALAIAELVVDRLPGRPDGC